MNKHAILFIILLFGGFTLVNAQTYDVTLQVNMNVKMVTGEYDSLRQDVRVTGSITDPQWDPANAPILTDDDGDGIFETTINVAAGDYEYKFLIGDAWGNDELQGQANRTISVSDNVVVDVVWFNDVSEVDFPVAPQDSVTLMLTVDMSRQRQIGAFDPTSNVVRAAGAFQGWSPGDAPDMIDYPVGQENLVYRTTYFVDPSTTYEYKFLIGTEWGGDETNNRSVEVAANDTAIWPVYFNDEAYDPDFAGDSVSVTFQVDMSVKMLEGLFDPAAEAVVATGSFQGWAPAVADSMEDTTGDSIFASTVKMAANVTYEYKYKIGRDASDNGYESISNRVLNLAAADTVLDPVFFDNDTVVSEIKDGSIEFVVDMDVLEEIGLYDPEADSLQLRGDFNGWSDSDPDNSRMNQNFLDPNEWFLEIPFEATPVGENKNFKYFVKLADEESIWEDGYERPLGHGGGNRGVEFAGTEDQVYSAPYDDIHTDWVLDGGVDLQVTLMVDMRPAMDPLLQATPFNPAADTVWWISEQPVFTASQGWADTDNMRVLEMKDADGDSIYEGTLTVLEPSFNAFEYRYAYYSVSAEGWQHEPSGFSNFAYRVRYAGQDAARSWPVNPWPMPVDTWTNTEIKSDQEENPTQSYDDYLALAVEEFGEALPARFKLYNNYPNPFNPTTNLKFDLPKAGNVKLYIYNVLGQKVATVYEGNLKAGQHIMTWNGKGVTGSQVASGVYFYKLETESHVAVRKMVMLK